MSFISDYLLYSSGNKAPKIFHEWTGVSVIASAIGRRVWVTQGHWNRYPNLYIILVGDPANGKSTAMGIGERLLESLGGVPIAPAAITKEAMTKVLGEGDNQINISRCGKPYVFSQYSIFSNEMVTLLGTAPIGMIEFFTDVWDKESEFVVVTKGKGTDKIINPFINILGCMTPEKTSNLLKTSIIDGGFSRRCIFVYNNKRGKAVPRPVVTPEQREAESRCLQRLKKIREIRGEFTWQKESEEFFDSWFAKNEIELNTRSDLVLQGYFGSKHELLLKTTMCLALAESDETVLTPLHMKKALDLLGRTEINLGRVFRASGDNKEAALAERIISRLEHARDQNLGPVLGKVIYKELFDDGNRDEIYRTLYQLLNTDQIEEVKLNNPGTYYKLKE